MSLILEALRKSEAERRRGQAPNLFDPPAPVATATPAPARVPLWWAVPVLLALVLAVLWWRSDSGPDGARPASTVANGAVIQGAAPQDASPALIASPAPGDPSEASPLPARVATPALPPTTPEVADEAPPLDVDIRPQPGAAAVATAPTQPASPPSAPALPPQPAMSSIASAAPTSPVAAPPGPEPPAAASNALMRLADLSATERNALPPLRMSMHLWAPDPAGRFVILDGTRAGEGDRVGSAVLDEITPDGAVLTWQGRRLKLPVR